MSLLRLLVVSGLIPALEEAFEKYAPDVQEALIKEAEEVVKMLSEWLDGKLS